MPKASTTTNMPTIIATTRLLSPTMPLTTTNITATPTAQVFVQETLEDSNPRIYLLIHHQH